MYVVPSLGLDPALIGILATIIPGILAISLGTASLVRNGQARPGRPSRTPAIVGLICGILVTLAGLYLALSYVLFHSRLGVMYLLSHLSGHI